MSKERLTFPHAWTFFAPVQDMGSMFVGGGDARQSQNWQRDLFRNAVKTIDAENQAMIPRKVRSGQQSLNDFPSGVYPRDDGRPIRDKNGKKIPNGWEMTGNSDILNNGMIIVAS
jgi:hypothetical protein